MVELEKRIDCRVAFRKLSACARIGPLSSSAASSACSGESNSTATSLGGLVNSPTLTLNSYRPTKLGSTDCNRRNGSYDTPTETSSMTSGGRSDVSPPTGQFSHCGKLLRHRMPKGRYHVTVDIIRFSEGQPPALRAQASSQCFSQQAAQLTRSRRHRRSVTRFRRRCNGLVVAKRDHNDTPAG